MVVKKALHLQAQWCLRVKVLKSVGECVCRWNRQGTPIFWGCYTGQTQANSWLWAARNAHNLTCVTLTQVGESGPKWIVSCTIYLGFFFCCCFLNTQCAIKGVNIYGIAKVSWQQQEIQIYRTFVHYDTHRTENWFLFKHHTFLHFSSMKKRVISLLSVNMMWNGDKC